MNKTGNRKKHKGCSRVTRPLALCHEKKMLKKPKEKKERESKKNRDKPVKQRQYWEIEKKKDKR